jgi:hypothetical protein
VRTKKDDTPYDLALIEFEKKRIPLAVIRTVNGKKEIISVS